MFQAQLKEQKLIADAYKVRQMEDGPEKERLKAEIMAEAKTMEKTGYRPGMSRPAGVYPPCGPNGFPMAPRKAEVEPMHSPCAFPESPRPLILKLMPS